MAMKGGEREAKRKKKKITKMGGGDGRFNNVYNGIASEPSPRQKEEWTGSTGKNNMDPALDRSRSDRSIPGITQTCT